LSGHAWQPLAPFTMLRERYLIKRTLKMGGMGAIYLAADAARDNESCAVKEMLDQFDTADDRIEGREWFAREATMLLSLRHPAIPAIREYFIESGHYYLVLDYIEGRNLEEILEHEGTPGLPEGRVMEWAAHIAEVLVYLHGRPPPIIFRDLKPANLMMSSAGTLYLVDFGIARVFSVARQGTMVGTPGYCPPEQYQGLAEPASDLYALAATCHHLLSGRDPRQAPPFSFPAIRGLAPQVSKAVEALLSGALLLDADRRGPAVDEFGRQARRIAHDLALGVVPSLTLGLHAPGDPLPPTLMILPAASVCIGPLATTTNHIEELQVGNAGATELRVLLRSSVSWLQPPSGQLRVAQGTTVPVPIRVETSGMAAGRYQARIELEGNGGTESIAVEVVLRHWIFNSLNAYLAFGAISITLAGFVVRALLLHG
jgi:serine/threonine protein kinase